MDFARIARHLFGAHAARRRFSPVVLDQLQQAIAAGERTHAGQVCFAVEGALPLQALWRGRTPRERAVDAFAQLRVWDTEHNSGVLIYVLLADRAIEIVADRGIAARVPQSDWDAVCARLRARFAAGEFTQGALDAIAATGELLARHFPPQGAQPNELPDRPVLL